jgi:antitoxin (DNA-binding transcriptional repressor) of toxin-antitoxin stability system
MKVVTIEEAQAKLVELVEGLAPGEEMILTRDAQPFAKLVGQPKPGAGPSFGRGKGKLIMLIEDDDHLEAFEEYMK